MHDCANVLVEEKKEVTDITLTFSGNTVQLTLPTASLFRVKDLYGCNDDHLVIFLLYAKCSESGISLLKLLIIPSVKYQTFERS